MKEQTAVEWLVEQIKSDQYEKALSLSEWMKVFEKAKAMEKEQICDAYYYGIDVDSWNVDNPYQAAEQYYNETFNKPINNKG
jgi:hypothetical protein